MAASLAVLNVLLVFFEAPCVDAQTYSVSAAGSSLCLAPAVAVTDSNECQNTAVAALGSPWTWSGTSMPGAPSAFPSGCIFDSSSTFNNIYFNTDNTNAGRTDWGKVCKTSSMSVGGDPIFYYGGRRIKFELPVGLLVPLLRTPSLTILGSTFAGNPWEQWFGHFLVTEPDGGRVVDVKIANHVANFNGTLRSSRGQALRTIEVTLGNHKQPFHREGGVRFPARLGLIDIACWRMTPEAQVSQARIAGAHRECVIVRSSELRFALCSSPASEYFGTQRHLATSKAHLDLVIIDFFDPSYLTGVLPELWRRASTVLTHNDTEPMKSPRHRILGLLSQDPQSEQAETKSEHPVPASRTNMLELI